MKEETHYAKQLYLYGEGTRPPIKNVKLLSKASGVPVRTLSDHMKTWRQLSTEIALRSEHSAYTLSLSEETLVQHKKEIEFLGSQVSKLRDQLADLSPDLSTYHVVLGSYQSALTKWEKSSGILAHYNTAESAMKERARAHERAKGKQEGKPPLPKRSVDKSRFEC